jgi:predicted kinase
VIIWLDGGFAAGKTTLAEQLHRRLPDAVVYDPEDVGLMLWNWIAPNNDFQDLPSWRELVVATALSLRRHHADTLIVPMSLTRDAYREEIFGGLVEAGEEVLHVFLEADAGVLRKRLAARVAPVQDPGAKQSAREWALRRVDAAIAAAARQPGGTLMLRSDRLTPAELADKVLSAASRSRPRCSRGIGTGAGRHAPSSMRVMRWEQHRRMPWRNGGGVTYEVASSPADTDLADFDWRISIAEVEAGGPFSAFPEIDRTIILVDVFVCLSSSVLLASADGTAVELKALDAALTTGSAPLTIRGDGSVVVIQLRPAAGERPPTARCGYPA